MDLIVEDKAVRRRPSHRPWEVSEPITRLAKMLQIYVTDVSSSQGLLIEAHVAESNASSLFGRAIQISISTRKRTCTARPWPTKPRCDRAARTHPELRDKPIISIPDASLEIQMVVLARFDTLLSIVCRAAVSRDVSDSGVHAGVDVVVRERMYRQPDQSASIRGKTYDALHFHSIRAGSVPL